MANSSSKDISLQKKTGRNNIGLIVSGYLIVIVLLASATFISHNLLEENAQRSASIVNENIAKYEIISTLRSIIRERMLIIYDMLYSEDPFANEEMAIKVSEKAGEFIKLREQLLQIGLTPSQQKKFNDQKKILVEAGRVIRETIEIILEDEGQGIETEEIQKARASNRIVLQTLKEMLEHQKQLAQKQLEETQQANKTSKKHVVLLIIFAILFSLITMAYIIYLISHQQKQLNQALQELADHNENLQQTVARKTRELIQAQQENIRMAAEISVSQKIQEIMLPSPVELDQIPHLDISIYMQPAEKVGGDYIDVLIYDNNKTLIAIGDVTGHGLESGLIMLMVQAIIRHQSNIDLNQMAKALNCINLSMYQNIERMANGKNLTLLLLDYHYDQQNNCGKFRLTGQHESVILIRNGKFEEIDTSELGFPVGMLEDIDEYCQETGFTLQSGDTMILYTDGITEASNEDEELYGMERFQQSCMAHIDKPVDEMKQAIIEDVCRFIGNKSLYDDISLIIARQQ